VGGYDRGNPLYVARALHEGSLVPGKYHAGYKTAYVSWGGKELEKKENFEILLMAGSTLEWKSAEGGTVPDGAVEGGHRPDKGALYIARGKVDGVESIGKLNPQHKFCHLPYGGKEHLVTQYQVLVNASPLNAPNPSTSSKAPPLQTASALQPSFPSGSRTAQSAKSRVATFHPATAVQGPRLRVHQTIPSSPLVPADNSRAVPQAQSATTSSDSPQQLQLQLIKQQEQLQKQLQLNQLTQDLVSSWSLLQEKMRSSTPVSGSNVPYPSVFTKTSFTPADLRAVKKSDPAFMTAWHAETHFYKMMSQTGKTNVKVKSLTVVQNPKLQQAFDAKMATFLSNSIPGDPVFAYHGTKSDEATLNSILMDNFDMKYAKRQAHGPGHYFSEYPDVSLGYGPGLIFCQLLSGKEYRGTQKTWPGFHSKLVQPAPGTGHSQMVIIQEADQILPLCLIHLQ